MIRIFGIAILLVFLVICKDVTMFQLVGPIRIPPTRRPCKRNALSSPGLISMLPPPLVLDVPSLTIYQQQALTAAGLNLPIAAILLFTQNKSLTKAGLLHATALGVGLWTFLGAEGWLIGVLYFVLGSLATKVKMAEKEKLGIAEKRGGARGPENVWGSAATAMVCATMTYFQPQLTIMWRVGFVTAFATKLADTTSSELGKAFGKTTYLVTTLKRVPKGTEGAVSLEGTVAGIIASIVIAVAAYALHLLSTSTQILQVVISSFAATTIESYIGAVFQDRVSWLNNELVNLIMTVIGAAIAVASFTLITSLSS